MKKIFILLSSFAFCCCLFIVPVNADNHNAIGEYFFDPATAEIGKEYIIYKNSLEELTVTVVSYTPEIIYNFNNESKAYSALNYQTRDYNYDKGTTNWSGIYPNGTYELKFSRSTLFASASFYMNFTISNGGWGILLH